MLGSPAIDPAVGNTSISGVVEPAVGLMPLTNYRRKNCRSPENIVHGGVVSMAEHTGINAWLGAEPFLTCSDGSGSNSAMRILEVTL